MVLAFTIEALEGVSDGTICVIAVLGLIIGYFGMDWWKKR